MAMSVDLWLSLMAASIEAPAEIEENSNIPEKQGQSFSPTLKSSLAVARETAELVWAYSRVFASSFPYKSFGATFFKCVM